MLSRRQFVVAATATAGSLPALEACSSQGSIDRYDAATRATWMLAQPVPVGAVGLHRELVRCATLASSSHNTQCWQFRSERDAILIIPDLSRRCAAVDPDDHHLFVSLGCATENLVQAAQALGLRGDASIVSTANAGETRIRVALTPSVAIASPLYRAIAERQHTRGLYDGQALASNDLAMLEHAGAGAAVRLLMLTDRPAMERVLEQVVTANSAQMADAAFVHELKHWVRFNRDDAVRTGDGLYTGSTGNPSVPAWLGALLFDMFMKPAKENEKYAAQIRSSAGIAVFASDRNDVAHWIEVGRCYERFALQCTALGIRVAMLNQPVEVAALRASFASSLGLNGQRPDLVVRFGRGPLMPRSLRRAVTAVMV
jgi:hypothetical protein